MAFITRGRWFLTIIQKKFFQKKCFAPFLGAFRGQICHKLYMDLCNPILTERLSVWYVFDIITVLFVRHIWCCIITGLILYWAIEKWKLKKKELLISKYIYYERGTPGHFFFQNLLLDLQFNGGIPRSRKGLLFFKIAFEIWRNWKSETLSFFWSILPMDHFM